LQHAEQAMNSTLGELLAVGRLFDDDFFDPGTSVNRTILVHIPKEYGAVELRVTMPLLTRSPDGLLHGKRLAWGVDNFGEPELLVCTGKGSESHGSKPQCQAADGTIERQSSGLIRSDQRSPSASKSDCRRISTIELVFANTSK